MHGNIGDKRSGSFRRQKRHSASGKCRFYYMKVPLSKALRHTLQRSCAACMKQPCDSPLMATATLSPAPSFTKILTRQTATLRSRTRLPPQTASDVLRHYLRSSTSVTELLLLYSGTISFIFLATAMSSYGVPTSISSSIIVCTTA